MSTLAEHGPIVAGWLTSFGSYVVQWLDRWQTLLTGFLAFLGAWLTVKGIQAQIRQAENSVERRRIREEYAARAVLPLALQSVTDYASAWLHALSSIPPHGGSLPAGFSPPAIASELIGPLQECIRHVERTKGKQIADLIAWLQVQYARSQPWIGGSYLAGHSVQQGLMDAAKLYPQASALFEYGRRSEEGDLPRPPKADVLSALNINGVHEQQHPGVWA